MAGKLRSREIKPKDGPEELLESYKYDINGEVLSGYSGTLKKSFNIVREKTKTTTYIDGSPHSIDEFDSSGKKRKTTWPSTNTTISFHYPEDPDYKDLFKKKSEHTSGNKKIQYGDTLETIES